MSACVPPPPPTLPPRSLEEYETVFQKTIPAEERALRRYARARARTRTCARSPAAHAQPPAHMHACTLTRLHACRSVLAAFTEVKNKHNAEEHSWKMGASRVVHLVRMTAPCTCHHHHHHHHAPSLHAGFNEYTMLTGDEWKALHAPMPYHAPPPAKSGGGASYVLR
ncbi:hypothetical protein EON67_06495, partial [archaeon]